MTRAFRTLFLLTVLALATGTASAQVTTGTPPFGSFGGGPDVINLANLNVHWTIPVLHKPGRGTDFTYDLGYDSSVWVRVTSGSTTSWLPVNGTWGWQGLAAAGASYISYSMTYLPGTCYNGGPTSYQEWQFSNFVYNDSFGVAHSFNLGTPVYFQSPGGSNCPPNGPLPATTPWTATASDGSGYKLQITPGAGVVSGNVIASNGSIITPTITSNPSGQQGFYSSTDRSGNQISSNNGVYTDTLGTTALTVAGTAPSNTTLTYTAPSGASASYKIIYSPYTVQTTFNCTGVSNYGPTNNNLVSEIDLPDSSKYTFAYEDTLGGTAGAKTGRLKSVTLPTGGTITYTYMGGDSTHNGFTCTDGSAYGLRRFTPDTGSNYWNYDRSGTAPATTTTITDPTTPTANQTVIQFQGIYETQRQVYQGSTSGTLLATTNTCYNGSTSPCNSTAITLPITQRAVITTLPVPGSTTLQSKSVAFYNSVGMPIEADVYAFGSGAPPTTPTRKTVITYAPLGNITAFQQTVSVKDGSDLLLAQTNYNYDETTPVPAPTGTPQLATVTGSRGNLTSVQKCISLSSCSIFLRTIMTYDTAGQLQTAKDPAGNQTSFSYTDRYYQDNGSNPPATYTSSVPTDAFVTTVTPPLNGPVTSGFYFYTGQGALSTDQNGNNSYTHFDSFGRPSTVQGPGQGTTLPWVLTTYAPSGLQADSYLGITDTTPSASCTQTRTYTYDALSRPSSVKVPEVSDASGIQCAVNYTYDNNSNLRTRIAPAPNQTTCTATVTTTYFYDALRRPTKITYSDGTTPTVQYGYDGVALTGCATTPPTLTDSNPKGSRTSMCDGSGATSWAHDAGGRILTEKRTILGVTQTTSYTYNLDGSIATVTYPSAKVVTYTVSNARRLTAARDASNNVQFATAASYAPPGGLSGMITGQISGGFAGITESHTYNSSLEYTSAKATSTAGTAMDLTLNYAVPGGDNGTVTGITNNVDALRTQSFTYDPLNRILSARSSATSGVDCWGQNFGPDGAAADDAVANLTKINNGTQAPPPCTFGSLNATVDANNRINTDSTYATDANGNMTKDGSGTGYLYTFDAENRLVQATGMIGGPYCYVYDGNSLRVAKKSGAASDCSGGTVTKLYWRSISGDGLAETDSSGSTTNAAYNEYVFFTGRRIASRNGVGAIFYYFADQVGSTRTVTTGSGPGQTPGLLCYDADFTPYGQEISHSERLQTTACPPNYRFTGYEYDPETGLHYAFARFYSPRLGRFLSTDPLGGGVGNLQSHNAYAYVVNDPLDLIDPTGMFYGPCGPFDDFCSAPPPPFPLCIQAPEQSCGPTGPTGPSGPSAGGGSGGLTPRQIKIAFYVLYDIKLMACIQEVFGQDGANVPPQTLKNAPILNLKRTSAQLTAEAGRSAIGLPSLRPRPNGTVYLASDWYNQPGGSVIPIFAGYSHELANILDMKMNPPGTTGGQPYGGTYGNPNDLTTPLDADTGRQVEICMFGSPKYPPAPLSR